MVLAPIGGEGRRSRPRRHAGGVRPVHPDEPLRERAGRCGRRCRNRSRAGPGALEDGRSNRRAPGWRAGGYLVANTGAGYLALGARCPHEGCEVAWVPEDRQVECPCHASRFAGDGTVLNPPARTNLTAFPAEADGQGNVVVHLLAGDGTFKERVQNGQVSFPINEFPALVNVGGVVLGRPDGFPGPLLVARLAAGTTADAIAAVSAVCTPLGCTVLPGAGGLQCPCHDSRFDLTGRFLQGPAGTNLLSYAVAFDGTTVTVSTTPRA